MGTKFRFACKNLMNLFMVISFNFRLFLRKFLVFLGMLNPLGIKLYFINGMKRDLSLLVKRTRIDGKLCALQI